MKIYTKRGDNGLTQIYADEILRVSKHDQILECYGTLDELNAHIGLLTSHLHAIPSMCGLLAPLAAIQVNLFQIGFAISAQSKLSTNDVDVMEQHIDALQATLAPQTSFILPGGCLAAAQAHVCRTVARRAERHLVALLNSHEVPSISMQYLNRLSDYLFVIARMLNQEAGISDIKVE